MKKKLNSKKVHGNKGNKRPDLSERNFKHGDRHTVFYDFWRRMKTRCNNKKLKNYNRYGGRGIKYDPKWENYLEFKKDMYFKYLYAKKQQYRGCDSLSLERIDNDGDYCFENCCFIPKNDQWKNTSKRVKRYKAISPEGKIYKTDNLVKFSKEHNLNHHHVYSVLHGHRTHHKGWDFDFDKEIKLRNYIAISPEGKIYKTDNLMPIIKEFNLISNKVYMVLNGKRNHHKGWKFERIDIDEQSN